MIGKRYSFFHPHLRLPAGESEDFIYQYLLPFCVEDGNREEMQNYLKEHLLRILYTYIENYHFPYQENVFDVVLFCEVIEHLASDPLRALLEIKRILKPNGYLVLTTPNVCRIENIIKLIVGGNIYDYYSRHRI